MAEEEAEDILFKAVFQTSPIPQVLVQKQGDAFTIMQANAAMAHYLHEEGELAGRDFAEFLEKRNAGHVSRALEVCRSSGLPVTIQVVPKIPHAVKVYSFVVNPLEIEGQDSIILDIMARPASADQDSLKKERDDAISLMTSVFDASDVGIVVTDHNQRIVRVNESFLKAYGWEASDLLGNNFSVLIPKGESNPAAEKRRMMLEEDGDSRKTQEIQIQGHDGELANALTSTVMLELSEGRRFLISTIVDITELKAMQESLRLAKDQADMANRAKSAFLANMSHELRTPLNAIIGFSDMMKSGTLGMIENPNYIEYLGDIHFSATHLLSIINDVLDMSKIEAGKMKLAETAFDISGLMDSVRRLMTTKAEEKNISIKLETTEDTPFLHADERLVRQILINLLSNSLKFSPEHSTITMRSLVEPGALIVSVMDEGIGIPEELLAEVVEPFGQVDDPKLNKGQGTGLGLPLAKAMMELHDGELELISAHGQGTTVICRFPESRMVEQK